MSAERVAEFWRNAEHATARADQARSDEMRRAWLIVARDWANMARREEARDALDELAYVAQNIPMAPDADDRQHTLHSESQSADTK
jgi:hypothetical protein